MSNPADAFAEMLVTWRASKRLTQRAAIESIERELGSRITLRTYEGWESGDHIPHGLTRVAIERMIEKCL